MIEHYKHIFEFRIIGELVRLFNDAVLLYNTEEENVHEAILQVFTAVLPRIKVFWVVIFCLLKYKEIGLHYTEEEGTEILLS